MNKFYIGDKVKIIKEGSIFYGRKTHITNFFVDVCKFLVDFGSDDALFYPWELELVESKEYINEKWEREELYSALKTIKKYCAEHSCRVCPLRLNDHCFLKNTGLNNDEESLAPINWDLKKYFNNEDKNENG